MVKSFISQVTVPAAIGEMDIYVSGVNPDGSYTVPVNLGPIINTPLNEESPFLSRDGKRLYFSSQGHNTIGGYDIFYATLNDDGTWSEPIAEPYPLNTTDDDLFYFPLGNDQGYLTRYEENGLGSGDIYKIKILPELPETAEINPARKDEVKDITQAKEVNEIQNAENNQTGEANVPPEEETVVKPKKKQ